MKSKNRIDAFRPVTAVNKLSKIKKNIYPSLLQGGSGIPMTQGNRRENSVSPRMFNRIKSAHPLSYDKEKLVEENIQLKTQLNKFRTDMASRKQEINHLENELTQKDKIIEEMMSENQTGDQYEKPQSAKASNTHLVINLKKQYKELKKSMDKLQKENETIKKNIKNTKLNEMLAENRILNEQIEKLKNLYEHSREQTLSIEQNIHDYNIMKEALSKQDYIILNFQENKQKMTDEISNLNAEIDKYIKMKNDKNDTINKLKQKLKVQYQINEKLVMTKENIAKTKEFMEMKNNYEKKLQKCRKDLAYYKDSNSKNEKLVREMKQMNENKNKMMNSNNINDKMYATAPSKFITTSNPQPPQIDQAPPADNPKYLLLQSIYLEVKKDKEKLQKQVEELSNKLSTASKTETKVILQNSFSTHELNKTINITEYEYLSDNLMEEFTYILLKNLEVGKIDMSIIESRILSPENLKLLNDEKNYKQFITTISTLICDMLKIQQKKDQTDIHSFIKTFLYNNYISKDLTNPEEFKTKLLSYFANINFYSIEQKQELNKVLCVKIYNHKDKLLKKLKYFDEDDSGYVTFTAMKKVMEQLNIKLKKEVQEYFIYVMKCFHEEGRFLRDLKYGNLIKILDETSFDPNENIDNNQEVKSKEEDEEEAIEITNEEYLNKVKEIIGKICEVLKKTGKTPDDYFLKIVSKSINDYKAIQLAFLVDVLKNEFGLELSHLEIFCLFTKIKPGDSMEKDYDDNVEEIIDYDKLKKEITQYMKNPPTQTPSTQQQGKQALPKTNLPNTTKSERLESNHNIRSFTDDTKAKEEEEDVKSILNGFMKKNKMNFERFVFPIHCMMKLTTNGKKYNRYVDIEFFKHFLYQNKILITQGAFNKFVNQDKILLCDDKINIDYLKFILSGQKGIRDNKMNDFMKFKPIKSKIEPFNAVNKKPQQAKKQHDVQSESMEMLKKDIFDEEEL